MSIRTIDTPAGPVPLGGTHRPKPTTTGYRLTALLPGKRELDLEVTAGREAKKTALREADDLAAWLSREPGGAGVVIRVYSEATGAMLKRVKVGEESLP